jgi:hypothetical protein
MSENIADRKAARTSQSILENNYQYTIQNTMVWIRYSDYGKQKKKKTLAKPKKKSKPRIEPKVKVIPGDHKVEFKKASEL